MFSGTEFFKVCVFFTDYGTFFCKLPSGSSSLSIVDVLVNGIWGHGIAVERLSKERSGSNEKCKSAQALSSQLRQKGKKAFDLNPLILLLNDPRCMDMCLSGVVGSDIAKLMQLKDKICGFYVPTGFVVTTYSCNIFYPVVKLPILLLCENLRKYDADQLKPLCDRVVEEISNSYFPAELYESLCEGLVSILEKSESCSFRVFPSVIGSSFETQILEAYLESFSDVIGLSTIIRSIKKCWASQFSFGAVMCKRSFGLPLHKSIAVVVQKTVPFEHCGYLYSCESISGNPAIMEIKETKKEDLRASRLILLKRNLQNQIAIHNISFATDDINSRNGEEGDGSNESSSSDESAWVSNDLVLLLGTVACKLERIFNFPLLIDWCYDGRKLYLLQIHPVSFWNVHQKFEVLYSWDTYFQTENEWFSSFYAGDKISDTISPLGMDVFSLCIEFLADRLSGIYPGLVLSGTPYYPKFFVTVQHRLFYCLTEVAHCLEVISQGLFKKVLPLMTVKTKEIGTLDEYLCEKYQEKPLSSFSIAVSILAELLFSSWDLNYLERKTYSINLKGLNSAFQVLTVLSHRYQDIIEPFLIYIRYTFCATIWTAIVLNVLMQLNGKKGDHQSMYRHFNYLMSFCSRPHDDDMPHDIVVLSKRIAREIDPASFQKMHPEDAQVWLQDSLVEENVKFSEFLAKHGHRSLKEMDISKKCWSMDPLPLVQALQSIVPLISSSFVSKKGSLDAVFSQLSICPNVFQRMLLKYIIPKCADACEDAKIAKSNFLKVVSYWRQAFHHLADKAVDEYHLPFQEVLFFLSVDEIKEVLGKGSPFLASRAVKAWEIFDECERNIFPSVSIGIPSALVEDFYEDKRIEVGQDLKGCPVSRGTALGTAIVARSFEDIKDIKKGSILIAPSPSMAWSVYFPVLSGFAADVGGLLSDGALTARDYGIPCVIGLIRASNVFQTGDRVQIDGNIGFIRRVS